MSQYRKAWVAVLGVLAQVAVVLADAADGGLLPAGWEPWVRVALATATAFGVYQVPNTTGSGGRHELGPDEATV